MHIETDKIALAGQLLLKLHQDAHTHSAKTFKASAFNTLQELIPFDMGIWATGATQDIIIHNVYSYNLPAEFIHNWEQFKSQDKLLQLLLSQPGKCFSIEDAYANEDRSKLEIVRKHSQVFGLEYALSIALKEPVTGLFSVISIYRNNSQKEFSEQENFFLQLLMPHLIESSQYNRFLYLYHKLNGKTFPKGCAISDQVGFLHQVDELFPKLLRLEWPDWSGASLPDVVFLNGSKTKAYKGKKIRIDIKPLDDVFFLNVRTINKIDSLTKREFTVANALSQGKSYKLIAEKLKISPSTVNKHALSIYTKLDVSNKTELAKTISAANPS
ncbi:MAG: helix-turn-helix transcriptional regulator [Pseudomonadota bacterium]